MEHPLIPDEFAEIRGERMKYVLVTGGVISGIGKGVVASSIGVLLQHSGVSVTAIKIDPYINIGTGLKQFNIVTVIVQMRAHFLPMSMEKCMCLMTEGR